MKVEELSNMIARAYNEATDKGIMFGLIERIGMMLAGETTNNVDALIAAGGLALPAPAPKAVAYDPDDDL